MALNSILQAMLLNKLFSNFCSLKTNPKSSSRLIKYESWAWCPRSEWIWYKFVFLLPLFCWFFFDFYDGIIKIENSKTFTRTVVDFCTPSYKLENYSVTKIILTFHYSNEFCKNSPPSGSSFQKFFSITRTMFSQYRSEQFFETKHL